MFKFCFRNVVFKILLIVFICNFCSLSLENNNDLFAKAPFGSEQPNSTINALTQGKQKIYANINKFIILFTFQKYLVALVAQLCKIIKMLEMSVTSGAWTQGQLWTPGPRPHLLRLPPRPHLSLTQQILSSKIESENIQCDITEKLRSHLIRISWTYENDRKTNFVVKKLLLYCFCL